MTIIIGIIADGEIVLASDSQTTRGTAKRSDINKISIVDFANGVALVAESGSAELSGKAVEILQEKAKGQKISDYRMIAELVEQSLREVKRAIVKQNEGFNYTAEKWEKFFREEYPVDLMVAYYFDSKPHIYTVDIFTGLASKAKTHYEAIGCGANLGGYLLSELSFENMNANLATAIAVYIIESVKRHDAFCGGATKVAILRRPEVPNPSVLPPPALSPDLPSRYISYLSNFGGYSLPPFKLFPTTEVEKLVEIVSQMDDKTKEERHKIIQKAFLKEATDFFKNLDTFKKPRKTKSTAK